MIDEAIAACSSSIGSRLWCLLLLVLVCLVYGVGASTRVQC
jgi:hypothetical protein